MDNIATQMHQASFLDRLGPTMDSRVVLIEPKQLFELHLRAEIASALDVVSNIRR
jgi:hypothetical protein